MSARRKVLGGLALATTLVVGIAGGGVWAANPFTDLGSVPNHANNIDAIFNAGITLGCTGNTYCPNDAVTRGQMASFIARTAALSSGTTKNFPKVNAKGPTQAYCALAAANISTFDAGPCTPSVATVDTTGNTGRFASMAIGADGLPVIAFNNGLNRLAVAHCGNPSCSAGNVVTEVDNTDFTGYFTSIAIGPLGTPIISHAALVTNDLKVVHCGNLSCTADNITTAVDTVGDVGQYSSIAIGTDGLPVISYYDDTNDNLKVAHCNDVTCALPGTALTAVDSTGNVGEWTSIEIGTDGFPVIAYRDVTNTNLKVAHCANAACIGGTTLTTVDDPSSDAGWTSIAIGTDGFPIISYANAPNEGQAELKVAHCTNTVCSTSDKTTLFPGTNLGFFNSIAIGTDGLPIISTLVSAPELDLRVARCANVACSALARTTDVDVASQSGVDTSIAIGTDGVPVIAYSENSFQNLKVARVPAA